MASQALTSSEAKLVEYIKSSLSRLNAPLENFEWNAADETGVEVIVRYTNNRETKERLVGFSQYDDQVMLTNAARKQIARAIFVHDHKFTLLGKFLSIFGFFK